ncbi:NUDIX hydrolase [Pseudomonas reidholzensis]|uniref:NUDIX hydrolase n=1 Tax=Pseudomonas reidholzensis TaxID=1785162 RepID=UPI000E5ADCD2|nr:NUDIX domain-containing protein [Pseudomonas reidholzensis]
MAFDDTFRLSSHAVIFNEHDEVLLLKANYGDCSWGLPGGSLEPGETIHEALVRECREEMGLALESATLTGVYFHAHYNSHAFIFRGVISDLSKITLSEEHTAWKFFALGELTRVQFIRVSDCLAYTDCVVSRSF